MARALIGRSEEAGSSASPGRIVVARERFAEAAARVLARGLRAAGSRARDESGGADAGPGRRGWAVSLALAGGSTPRAAYGRLAGESDLPWSETRIFFGDERRVPPDDPESNYRMAREALLSRLPVPVAEVHRMEGEAPDPEGAARRYAARLPETLDLLILGVGADGHTASLFPGAPSLGEKRRRVVAATAPLEPRGRLTITPPVIRAAARIVVLASGDGKAAAVARALEGPWDPAACPAQLARAGIWVVDEDAAGALRERPDRDLPGGDLPGGESP